MRRDEQTRQAVPLHHMTVLSVVVIVVNEASLTGKRDPCKEGTMLVLFRTCSVKLFLPLWGIMSFSTCA